MKVLLAVDGSKNALDAARFLIEHADWVRERPQVELLFVHPPVPRVRGMGSVVGKREIQRYYEEEGEEGLAGVKKLLEAAGVAYRARILIGPVAETIVSHAKSARCDMILVGNRGMTAAGNLLLGSVATKVLHLSPMPVLLVK